MKPNQELIEVKCPLEFADADEIGVLTPGKSYKPFDVTFNGEEFYFWIEDDVGDSLYCRSNKCAHLDQLHNWNLVFKNDVVDA